MNDVSRFSIYRETSLIQKTRDEAMALSLFLDGIQNFVPVDDVSYQVPDPPDFSVRASGKMIGLELTKANPKPFKRGGFAKYGEFKTWKLEKEKRPRPRHEFEWGTFKLRDSLAALESDIKRKAERAKTYHARFDELWLVIQAEKGSPHGDLVGATTRLRVHPDRKQEFLEFEGKHLFGVAKICEKAFPFNCVLFFSGPNLLSFPVGTCAFNLPKPNEELLRRGESASDKYLDWSRTLRSITRHYDESQGDITSWLRNPD